jgi:hypothetical protein
MEELRQKAHELGVTMTDEAAAKAHKLDETLQNLQVAVTGLRTAIGEAVAPMVQKYTDELTKAVEKAGDFVKQNPQFVDAAVKGGVALVGLGTSLVAVATIVPKVTAGFGMLNTALHGFAGYVGIALAGIGMVAYGLSELNRIQQEGIDGAQAGLDVARARQILVNAEAKSTGELDTQVQKANDALADSYDKQIAQWELIGNLNAEQQKYIDDAKAWVTNERAWSVSITEANISIAQQQQAVADLNDEIKTEFGKWAKGEKNTYEECLQQALDMKGLTEGARKDIQTALDQALAYDALLEKINAARSSWNSWGKSTADAQMQALGITTDSILNYLQKAWGMSLQDVVNKLAQMGIGADDLTTSLDVLGVNFNDLYTFVYNTTHAMDALGDSMNNAMSSIAGGISAVANAAGGLGGGVTGGSSGGGMYGSWQEWVDKFHLGDYGVTADQAQGWNQQYLDFIKANPEQSTQYGTENIYAFYEKIFGANWKFIAWVLGLLGVGPGTSTSATLPAFFNPIPMSNGGSVPVAAPTVPEGGYTDGNGNIYDANGNIVGQVDSYASGGIISGGPQLVIAGDAGPSGTGAEVITPVGDFGDVIIQLDGEEIGRASDVYMGRQRIIHSRIG